MTHTQIMFILAKLVVDSEMFAKGDGFPDIAETPPQRDVRAMMYYDYRQGESVQQKLPQFVKLLWGPVSSAMHSAQLVQYISVRQDDV